MLDYPHVTMVALQRLYLNMGLKKIGRGIQYSVYACEHDRVTKIPASNFRRFCTRVTWIEAGLTNVFRDIIQNRVNAERSFIGLKRRLSDKLSPLLGNPTLFDDFSYDQDLVKPVGEYFAENHYSRNVIIVDRYIVSLKHSKIISCCNICWILG